METDFVLIDRGVVHSTKRRRRQVFSGCVFWVVFNSIQFFYQDNLLKRAMALWSPKRRENSACICLIPRLIAS